MLIGDDATILYVDGGTGGVGIGLASVAGTKLALPLENDAATPTLAFGDGDTGFYESSNNVLYIGVAAGARFSFTTSGIQAFGTGRASIVTSVTASATVPPFTFVGDGDTGVGRAAADQLSLIAGGVEGIRITESAAAITAVDINGPVIADDTLSVGTGVAAVAGTRITLPLENDAVTPTLAFGDGDTGIYESSDDILAFAFAGGARALMDTAFHSPNNGRFHVKFTSDPSATVPIYAFVNDTDTGVGRAAVDQLSLISGGVEGMRIVEAASAVTLNLYGSTTLTGDLNPEADGTRDLGTQTTAQWANLWADLVNGAEISLENRWRMMEAELYGYPPGWALGHSDRWEAGRSIWHADPGEKARYMAGERPVFAVTDDFIEYKGRRLTPEILDRVLALVA